MMAVWSEINFSSLFSDCDISPEHYHPKKLKALADLMGKRGITVGELVSPVKELVHPKEVEANNIGIFDLSAAQKHVLQNKDAITDERVSTKKVARNFDVIISRLRSYLKQVAYIPFGIKEAYLSTEFIVLRSLSEANIAFLVPFFLSDHVQTILAWSQDGSEHPRFKEKILLNLQVPRQIIDASEDLCGDVEKANDLLKRSNLLYQKAEELISFRLDLKDTNQANELIYESDLSNVMVKQRIDAEHYQPSIDRILGKIKKTGNWDYLGNKLKVNQRGKQPIYSDRGLPVINSKNVRTGEVIMEDTRRGYVKGKDPLTIKKGDVLLNGTGIGTIGRCAPYFYENKAWPDNHVTVLRPMDTINPAYIAVYLNSCFGQCQVKKHQRGSSGQLELYPDDIAKFIFWEAPKSIQKEIEKLVKKTHQLRLDSLSLIESAKKKIDNLLLS